MLEYNRKPLQVPGGPPGKVPRLVLILLYSGEEGVRKEELLDVLYGNSECSNPSGGLRAAAFRLCKLLEGGKLPSCEYIHTDGGTYKRDGGKLPVYIDARDFEDTAKEALRIHDEAFLERACGLCQGEFLAQLAGEKWVSVVGVRYQELYFSCLRATSSLMEKNREYNGLLEIHNYACKLCLYEECQVMKVDCLIVMKRFKEAMQVYDAAASQHFEGQGPPPSEKILERLRIMSGQIRYTSNTLKDIRDNLHERDRIDGPYYCAYPAFIDCYRFLAHMAGRVDFSSVLLCYTLLDTRGKPLDTDGEPLKAVSEKLHDAITKPLRKGDLSAYYNLSQYLVILNDAPNEYRLWIHERIDRNPYLWDGGRKAKFSYQVMPESSIQEK